MTANSLTNKRVSWVDTLRSISIFSIVLVHTGRVPDLFRLYFSSFYMPVFFFISGMFVKESIRNESFGSFARNRARRLLIPYVVFSVFSYILWILLIGKVQGDVLPENVVLHFLANTLYGIAGHGWLDYNVTLWFFPCLFVTEIIFFFLVRLPSHNLLGIVLFGLSLLGYFYFEIVDVASFRLPFGADIAITAVVFYGAGYLFRSHVLNKSFDVWVSPPIIAIGALLYVVFSNLNQESSFVIGFFGENYLYFYMAAFSGILFWMQISRLITPSIVLEEIGKNTLVIFPLHLLLFPFFTGTLVYIFKLPKVTVDSWHLLGIPYTFLAIAILVPAAWCLNQYAPFLLGRNLKSTRRN